MPWTPSQASNQTHPKNFGETVHSPLSPFLSSLYFYEPLSCAFFPSTPPVTNTDTNSPTFLKPEVNIWPTSNLLTDSLSHSPGLFFRPLIQPFPFLCLSVIIPMLLCSPSFVSLVSLSVEVPQDQSHKYIFFLSHSHLC